MAAPPFVINTDSECSRWSISAAELRLNTVEYCRKSPSDTTFADFLPTDPSLVMVLRGPRGVALPPRQCAQPG
jgi:hypothetical protein